MPIILYELIGTESKRYYSPNTYKTRLSLLHKGVSFETREVTYHDLRYNLAKRLGMKRPTVPMIEVDDGTFISDSWNIALWLEETYPDAPSLFLPASESPVQLASPEMAVAKSYAQLINCGLGDSDSQWSPFFEICVADLANLFSKDGPDSDYEYFTSDVKLGSDGWNRLRALDKEPLIAHAKASLLPLEALLGSQAYLTGPLPGFVDYVVYGRYCMMKASKCTHTDEVWIQRDSDAVRNWIERLEKHYHAGLTGLL